jgi:hypothetical protein
LSGCPSVTDSLVKIYSFAIMFYPSMIWFVQELEEKPFNGLSPNSFKKRLSGGEPTSILNS